MKIQNVSVMNTVNPFKQNKGVSVPADSHKKNSVLSYADSFVKNAGKSLPALTVFTGIWTAVDVSANKVPVKTALANNIKGFFVPVLLLSSALLAIVENKNLTKKDR